MSATVESLHAPSHDGEARRRLRFTAALIATSFGLALLSLAVGSDGLSWRALQNDWASEQGRWILEAIRAPRTLGAWAVGALLGLAGATAQGLFRNPLADPYLLGTAAGASLGVVLVLAASSLGGQVISLAAAAWLDRIGLVTAAWVGALAGVGLTLVLARGAQQTVRLLLAGVVVGVVMGAVADLITTWAPDALRGKQTFLLGTTGFLGWPSVGLMLTGLAIALPLALRLARVLDALTLGEDTAATLGLPLAPLRTLLIVLLALCTGLAVSQAGLVAFVGLVTPHLVRRFAPSRHGFLLAASAATGGALLLAADVLARVAIAPQELPVGVLTALLGGGYLLWLLHRRAMR